MLLFWSVTVIEFLPEEKKIEAKTAVLGQAVVDLLPLLKGTVVPITNYVLYCNETNRSICHLLYVEAQTALYKAFMTGHVFLFCLQVSAASHPQSN